ncbi:MAG: hypothetical protein HRT94_04995 [Alphaproteobacteria bacterium]|nr:hypothetical protein [Alphaproteobacteria bacterium]
MPAKEPFHAKKKDSVKEQQSEKKPAKSKHDILLTSKNVEETQKKLRNTGKKSATPKEFSVEHGNSSHIVRANLDSAQASTGGLLRASRESADNFVDYSVPNADNTLFLGEETKLPKRRRFVTSVTNFAGLLLTVIWGGVVAGYVDEHMGWSEVLAQQPHILGGFLAGILAPVAFLWFLLHQFQRGSEIGRYTEALRSEMQNMLFPSSDDRRLLQKDMQALCEQATELSLFSKTMLGSIHKARAGLKEDMAELQKMSSQSERHLEGLSHKLEQRSGRLVTLTSEIEARTSNIEEKSLRGAEAWDETTLKILERAADIEAAMNKGANQISRAVEHAAEEGQNTKELLDQTFDGLEGKAEAVQHSLSNLSASMSENQKELTLSADLFAADTKRLSDLLEGQLISLQDLEGLSQKSMTIMQQTLEQDAKQQKTLSETLQDRLVELATISEMAQEKALKVEEVMKGQIETVGESMDKVVERMGAKLSEAETTMSEKQTRVMSSLTDHADDVKSIVEQICYNFDDAERKVSDSLKNAVEHTKSEVAKTEDALFDRFDDTVKSITSRIDDVTGAMVGKHDDIISKIDARTETFAKSVESVKDDVRRAEEALFERHENIHNDFKETYRRLTDAVGEAKTMMQGIDIGLEKERERIGETVERFKAYQQKFSDVLDSHKDSFSRAESMADKTFQMAKEMIDADSRNQENFMVALEARVRSLKEAAASVDEQAEMSNAAIEKIGSAQDMLEKQSELLTRVTKQAEEEMSQMEESLFLKQREVKKNAESVLADLSAIDSSLEARLPQILSGAKNIQGSLQAVTEDLEKGSALLDQKLKAQAAKVEHLSRHSVDHMSDSVGALADSLVQIGSMVDGVQDSIEQSTQKFTDKAAQLTRLSKEASVATDQAASIFGKRSEAMAKVAEKTTENVEKLQTAQKEMRQEVFMGAAKFVIESLHSLAVDLTRAIDGGIHERMWKAYQNGDIGIFTSYLVSIEDELPIEDYQRKFNRESEFRRFVQSFINQYEDVIQQAIKVDHGALLATTFNTSDVGKLYRLLCNIADSKPLTQIGEVV